MGWTIPPGSPGVLLHFSEDPLIPVRSACAALEPDRYRRCGRSILRTRPSIGSRDCPRVAVWANDRDEQELLRRRFSTDATRLHTRAPTAWRDAIRECRTLRISLRPDGVRTVVRRRRSVGCARAGRPRVGRARGRSRRPSRRGRSDAAFRGRSGAGTRSNARAAACRSALCASNRRDGSHRTTTVAGKPKVPPVRHHIDYSRRRRASEERDLRRNLVVPSWPCSSPRRAARASMPARPRRRRHPSPRHSRRFRRRETVPVDEHDDSCAYLRATRPSSATFVSPQHGRLLESTSSGCGDPGSCDYRVLTTTDGGASWRPLALRASRLGEAKIRFADARRGFVYDSRSFLTTVDVAHWTPTTLPFLTVCRPWRSPTASSLRSAAHRRTVTTASMCGRRPRRACTGSAIPAGALWRGTRTATGNGVFEQGSGWLLNVNRRSRVPPALSGSGNWATWTAPCSHPSGAGSLSAPSAVDVVASCDEHVWGGGPITSAVYFSHDGGTTFRRRAAPRMGTRRHPQRDHGRRRRRNEALADDR